MSEKPILFSTPMIKALLENRKSQTRRIMKPQPEWLGKVRDVSLGEGWFWKTKVKNAQFNNFNDDKELSKAIVKADVSPYFVGQKLWVRETWKIEGFDDEEGAILIKFKDEKIFSYPTTQEIFDKYWYPNTDFHEEVWRPSIFMPRFASRITLEVTKVRVERVQSISEQDAFAEGIDTESESYCLAENHQNAGVSVCPAIYTYSVLWDKINGKIYPWNLNPWVWIVDFKRVA